MELATMLQIKLGLGLAAMALVCIVIAVSKKVIIAGEKALTSVRRSQKKKVS